MNFGLVAFLDTLDLAASLRTRMGLFSTDEPRVLQVRGPKANAADPDDDLAYAYSARAKDWAEMKIMLARISRIGEQNGGIEFGRIFFEALSPGACLPWDGTDSDYSARYSRAHLALRTNPAAIMHAGVESLHLHIGYLTAINRRVWGSAINLGEHPRVHLVVDYKRKEQNADG